MHKTEEGCSDTNTSIRNASDIAWKYWNGVKHTG